MRGPLWAYTAGGYQPVLRAEPMQGYWLWSGRASSRTVQGVSVAEPVRTLDAGWNLLEPSSLQPYTSLAMPLDTAPAGALVGPAWGWNPLLMASCGAGLSLSVGDAYWVYASVPTRVRLGP